MIGDDIIEGLNDFTEKLKSGEPIEATQIQRIETPDGSMHVSKTVMLQEMNPVYQSNIVVNPDSFFEHLKGLNWLSVTEARKEYFMSDVPRSYIYGTGRGVRTYTSESYTNVVSALQDDLNAEMKANFNVCFLNRYDDQKQHLGWHSDNSPSMDKDHPIAVVSFGVAREIWWQKIGFKGQIPSTNKQLLEHGSLFVMPSGFQELYQHRIPKHDRSCGMRISLTFRRYK